MEGEYDKDPSLFPFPKEMIEEYIINSKPFKKRPEESADVTQSSNAKTQTRLLLAKKKIKRLEKSKARKDSRPSTATEIPKQVAKKGYGKRKSSVKGNKLKSPAA
jgi:hypothetical protein